MRDPPPEVIASWPKPNYINPESQGHGLKIVAIVFSVIASIVVSLRLYVRKCIIRAVGWDDWFMFLALIFTVALAIVVYIGTGYGWGLHIWDNKREWAVPSRFVSWLSQLLFILSAGATKLSILFSFLRLPTSVRFTVLVQATMGVMVAWIIAFVLILIFRCKPVDLYWLHATEKGCASDNVAMFTCIGINLATDIWLVVLPIPMLWTLRLPVRQKIALIVLLGLGGLCCIAAAVRIYYTDRTLNKTYDVTWYGSLAWAWTSLECLISIICGTMATLRPLVKIYLPRLLGISSGQRSNSHSRRKNRFSGAMDIEREMNGGVSKTGGSEAVKSIGKCSIQGHRNSVLVTIGGGEFKRSTGTNNLGIRKMSTLRGFTATEEEMYSLGSMETLGRESDGSTEDLTARKNPNPHDSGVTAVGGDPWPDGGQRSSKTSGVGFSSTAVSSCERPESASSTYTYPHDTSNEFAMQPREDSDDNITGIQPLSPVDFTINNNAHHVM